MVLLTVRPRLTSTELLHLFAFFCSAMLLLLTWTSKSQNVVTAQKLCHAVYYRFTKGRHFFILFYFFNCFFYYAVSVSCFFSCAVSFLTFNIGSNSRSEICILNLSVYLTQNKHVFASLYFLLSQSV